MHYWVDGIFGFVFERHMPLQHLVHLKIRLCIYVESLGSEIISLEICFLNMNASVVSFLSAVSEKITSGLRI